MKFIRRFGIMPRVAVLELAAVFVVVLILFIFASNTVWNYVFAADMGQRIADKANELAWPYGTSSSTFESKPTDAFIQATERVNSGLNNNDCLSFVKTVVIDSGADAGFPSDNGIQETALVEYMSSSDKWDQIETTNESDLKPGDILVSADTENHRNHIFVFIGEGRVAGANLNGWYGRVGTLANEWDLGPGGTPFYYSGNQYKIFRSSVSSGGSSSTSTVSSGTKKSKLSQDRLDEFVQNNIMFYDPSDSDCVDPNGTNGVCGNTIEEKVWTILRQTFDSVHAAAAFGSIANEGGFQPVKWQYDKIVNTGTCDFVSGVTWDDIYNGKYDGQYGVGSFGLTSGLSTYLHYINDNEPDLLEYFKDPSNTCLATGDDLAKKIGTDKADRLINLEVNYFINQWLDKSKLEKFQSITNLNEAATYWAHDIEVCSACGYDEGDAQLSIRAAEAQKYYDKYKDYTCSTSGGSCSTLAEQRTKMWTEASQEDREHFMYIVSQEDYTIAGVEGYMNQVIAKYGNDGTLHDWIFGQCPAFTEGGFCAGDHTITNEDQDMINEALNGSNNIKFAVGNATGGSSVGAGKIVCVWDGTKCRDDVDYSVEGGMGACSVYSPSADFGECWGLEGAEDWAESMKQECGANTGTTNISGSNNGSSTVSTIDASSSGAISGNDITWIGDSYSTGAQSIIEKEFPGISFGGTVNTDQSTIQDCKFVGTDTDCLANPTNPSGLKVLKNVIAAGNLKPYLVFALGTNGGWSDSDVTEFNNIMSAHPNTKVVLVTSKTLGESFTSSNALLKKMADENANYSLADWTTVYQESFFGSDDEHPYDNNGFDAWVRVIKDALSVVASTSSGSYSTGVKWDNGWIVEGTMEGLVIEDVTTGSVQLSESQVNPIGSYTTNGGKPNKILLHSTDGTISGLAAYPDDGMYPAHFTIDLKKRTISQHFSIYQPSMAVGTYDKEGPIQFEIVGYSDTEEEGYSSEADLQNYSDEDWEYLAKVMIAIHEETGIPLTSSVDWANGNNELSPEEFKSYEGVLGHMHTPGNEKIDPGDIWKFVSAAIDRLNGRSNGCGNIVDGFVWYAQWDERWVDAPFGSSTIGPSGCGPTSFAMLATALLGREILPDEVAKISGDADMYVPGAGSSWAITEFLAKKYGLEYEQVNVNGDIIGTVSKYLKEGWMIHTTGAGSAPFTPNGHYIGIRGITSDGKWLIADSAHQESDSTERQWDPSEIVSAGMNTGDNIHAIRASAASSGGSLNCDICDTGNSQAANTNGVMQGFSSIEDAEKVIINAYESMESSEMGNKYDLALPHTGDYHDNCVAFSTWFINHYTNIAYSSPPDGNMVVDDFYARNKSEYPDLTIDKEPSVYSLASWSVPTMGTSSGNHTGIVIGIDKDNNKILIAEAGWDNPDFTGVHEYDLGEATGDTGYQYINLNKYLKTNMGLK